jgi:ferredoxin
VRADPPARDPANPAAGLLVSQEHGGRPAAKSAHETELRVNPIACDAHGLCIELLPELISADPWGYPVIRPGPVPPRLLPLARRAVADCPTLALLLAERPAGDPRTGPSDLRRD